jgi:hypothetical protein
MPPVVIQSLHDGQISSSNAIAFGVTASSGPKVHIIACAGLADRPSLPCHHLRKSTVSSPSTSVAFPSRHTLDGPGSDPATAHRLEASYDRLPSCP